MVSFRFKNLEKEYPPVIARAEIHKYFSFLTAKTMANLDSVGRGPAEAFRCGRAVLYPTSGLLLWLDNRIKKTPFKKEGEVRDASSPKKQRGRKTKIQQVSERRG